MDNVPDYQAGSQFSASWLNSLLAWLRGTRVRAIPPLYCHRTPTEQVLTYRAPASAGTDFRVTGGTNPYAGYQVDAAAGGAWTATAGGIVATTTADPLYERNASASVSAGFVVRAVRCPTSMAWVFDRSGCS